MVGKACILRVPCPNRRLLVEGRQQVHSSREQLQQSLTLPFTSGKSRGKTGKILIPPVGKRLSRSSRAGLQFPVTRFHRKLRSNNAGKRIATGAPGEFLSSCHILTKYVLLQYILPLSLSISWRKSLNSPAMPPRTTRNVVFSLDTFNSPSEMTTSTYLILYSRFVDLPIDFRLQRLLGNVVIAEGGVVPCILPQLLPQTKKPKIPKSQELEV